MSETKNWRSTRSYGVILARYNEHLNIPEYLMVCRKSTYCYVDFILGKYDDKNTDYLKFMVKNMTYSERISISTKNFEDLWKDLYYNSRAPNGAVYDYVNGQNGVFLKDDQTNPKIHSIVQQENYMKKHEYAKIITKL